MCEVSEKLVAWLDHELPEREGVEVEQHLHGCAECSRCLAAYKEVGRAIDSYCDKVMEEGERRRVPNWVPVLSGVAAAAAALILVFPRAHVEPRPVQFPAATASTVLRVPPAPIAPMSDPARSVSRRHSVAPVPYRRVNWVPAVPTIEIAIPAAAMFPPGAVPEGVTLTAEFSVAADGAQQVRLRP